MPLTFIAFLIDPAPITKFLAHIGEPTSPPLTHPARGPPQTDLDMGAAGGEAEEFAQESFPDDLNQSPEFDPTEPEPIVRILAYIGEPNSARMSVGGTIRSTHPPF
ncbi:hypothetical protein ACFL3S_12755 [Gemmatimonadota bacterium]